MHDYHVVRYEREHAKVVGDEDHGNVAAVLDAHEFLHDGELAYAVYGRCGLVRYDEDRIQAYGKAYHDALQHAARELVGVFAQNILRIAYAHEGEDVEHHVEHGPGRKAHVLCYGFLHLIAYAVERIKAGHGVLQHNAYA